MLSYPIKNFFLFLNSDSKNTKTIKFCYFTCFFLVSLLSLLFSIKYLNRYPNASVFNIRPLFGYYIKNIVQEGAYYYKTNENGMNYYALYVPLIPYFMAAIAYIYNSISFAFLAKNLIAALFTAYSLKLVLVSNKTKTYFVLIALMCIFLIPYNLNIMLDLDHEEAYSWSLLLLLFSLLCYFTVNKQRITHILLMGILLAALILTKSSHVFLCLFITGYLVFKIKSRLAKFIPVGFMLGAFLSWGIFTYINTGYFATLNHMSSWNGRNLYKGNSEVAFTYYPKYHVDMYTHLDPLLKADLKFSNEWEDSRYFEAKAKSFMLANPLKTLDLVRRKAIVFFLDVRENNILPYVVERFGKKSLPTKVMFHGSMVINRVLLFVALTVAIGYAFTKKYTNQKWKKQLSILLLCMVAFYALPYIVGHANYRHVIPLIPISTIFLLWVFSEKSVSQHKNHPSY